MSQYLADPHAEVGSEFPVKRQMTDDFKTALDLLLFLLSPLSLTRLAELAEPALFRHTLRGRVFRDYVVADAHDADHSCAWQPGDGARVLV